MTTAPGLRRAAAPLFGRRRKAAQTPEARGKKNSAKIGKEEAAEKRSPQRAKAAAGRGGEAARQTPIEQNKNFVQLSAEERENLPSSKLRTSLEEMSDYRTQAPPILCEFLSYHEIIKAHSKGTVDEYFLDLRNFFRYLKKTRNPELHDSAMEQIDITDVDLDFVSTVTMKDIYDYMLYLSRDRARHQNSAKTEYGLSSASRARKLMSIRSFYNYLTTKTHQLEENPVRDMDAPKKGKKLPEYLTLDESLRLLSSVEGKYPERDYCMLTLFLNCGLRISELIALNLSDIQGDTLRILGKGNKTRILYLNEACQEALREYLAVRHPTSGKNADALFLSARDTRPSRSTIHAMVKRSLTAAGLDSSRYSAHKLRHTAATLMIQNGVDVRTVQEVLGHEHLNTTEIYTHIDNEGLRIAAKATPLSHVKRTGKQETNEDSDYSNPNRH